MIVARERPREPARRRFVNRLLGGSFGALIAWILYPVLRFLEPVEIAEAAANQVEAGRIDDPALATTGFKIVPFGNEPVILVKTTEGELHALAATCTHLDCIVEYRRDQNLLWCNCHGGQFDVSGRVVGGPPPKPLRPYRVHVVEGTAGAASTVVIEKV